jgi:hypothetical protein
MSTILWVSIQLISPGLDELPLADRDPDAAVVSWGGRPGAGRVVPERLGPQVLGDADELLEAERPVQVQEIHVLRAWTPSSP